MRNRTPSLNVLLLSLAVSAASLWAQVTTYPTDWKTGWAYRILLSNMNPVGLAAGEAHTNFPVLIRFSNDVIVRSGVRSDGGDMHFVGMDGKSLFHQIEAIDEPNGNAAIWICVPYFTNKTSFYLYYSNANSSFSFDGANADESFAGTFPTLATNFISTRVWDSNFQVVYHFSETSGSPRDSTRNSNDVNSFNSVLKLGAPGGAAGTGMSNSVLAALHNSGAQAGGLTNSPATAKLTNGAYTASIWMMLNDYPSNYLSNTIAGPSNNTSVVFAMRAVSSIGSTDGKGVLQIDHGTSRLRASIGSRTYSNYNVPILPQRWYHYAVSGGWNPVLNPGTDVKLDVSGKRYTGNTEAGSYGTSVRDTNSGLNVFGCGGTAAPVFRYIPYGACDEYRLQTTVRSSNWLFTEHTNVVTATNGDFFLLGSREEAFASLITNTNQIQPRANVPTKVMVFPNSISVALASTGNFVSNIVWVVSNPATTASLAPVSSNFASSQQTNWALDVTFPSSGTWRVYANMKDASNVNPQFWAPVPVFDKVVADLSSMRLFRTNAGVLIDLFGGLGDSGTESYTVRALRDGRQTLPADLGNGRLVDTNGLFYSVPYRYDLQVVWPGGLTYTNFAFVNYPEPSAITNSVSSSGDGSARLARSFEWALQLPSNASGSSSRTVVVAQPEDYLQSASGRQSSAGYRQHLFYDLAGGTEDVWGDGSAVLTTWVPVTNNRIFLPGLAVSNVEIENAPRFALGVWDGRDWIPRPTSVSIQKDFIVLTAGVTREGRYAVLYGEGVDLSGNALTSAQVSGRLLQLGGSSETRFIVSFPNAAGDSVRFTLMDLAGRTVYDQTLKGASSAWWDGSVNLGGKASAGIYLWTIKVGGMDNQIYRGSIVVAR